MRNFYLFGQNFILDFHSAMFPRTLPRAAVRRLIQQEKVRRELVCVKQEDVKASVKGNLIVLWINGTHCLAHSFSIFSPQIC